MKKFFKSRYFKFVKNNLGTYEKPTPKRFKSFGMRLVFLLFFTTFLGGCRQGSTNYLAWHRFVPAVSSHGIIPLYPYNESVVEGTTLVFHLKPVVKASNYEILISQNKDFAEVYYNCETDGKKSIKLDTHILTGSGPYYWKARARKEDEEWGEWSDSFSFTYREQEWVNMQPVPESLITDTTPAFQWEPLYGYEEYELQWAFDKKGLIQADIISVEGTLWQLPKEEKLVFGQAVYWRIRPKGRSNRETSWTTIRNFTTAWLDEYSSSYGYGKNTILDTTPLLDWEDGEQAVRYEIQFGNSVEKMEVSDPVSCRDSLFQVPVRNRFYYGESIYWRFRGINEDDVTGPWSGTYSGMFDWNIRWSGIGPASGAVFYDTNPDLIWDEVKGAEFYQLRYAFDIKELTQAEIHNSDGAIYPFSEPGKYNRNVYWQLRAVNTDGIPSRWSRLFRYQNRWDIEWSDRTPDPGLITIVPDPQFNWAPVEKAVSYRIRLDFIENGIARSEIFDTTDTEWTFQGEMAPAVYNWYLIAVNEKGLESPVSSPMKFEIRDINKTVEALGMSLHMVRVAGENVDYKGFELGSFMMADTEITQKDYQIITGAQPSHSYGEGDHYPVYYISWFDAVDFCNILSEVCGLEPVYDIKNWKADFTQSGFRLPTEAEWEYAASGGKQYAWPLGDDFKDDDYIFNRNKLLPVAQHPANLFGLYNIGGSLQEWCHDWWQDEFLPGSDFEKNTGYRAVRGGSWKNKIPDLLLNEMRNLNFPSNTSAEIGFRPVIEY